MTTASTYDALHDAAAWLDLSDRGLIRVTGEDRARLLHAMSTNDIQGLKPSEGVYVFFLTAQGRIVADAYVYNAGESLILDTEPELAAKLRDHLAKYIIADDVELQDETGAWAIVGLEGPHSLERAADLDITVPAHSGSIEHWRDGLAARVSVTGMPGLRIFLPLNRKREFVQLLQRSNIPAASADDLKVVRIENGFPRYGEDITERFLVQETEAMHAVHPNKGCYLGQEIVERVRSRAQVHRHLKAIRITGTVPPLPGTKLTSEGKDVGEITSAAFSPRFNEVVALGYIRTEAIGNDAELLIIGGEPVTRAYLPSSPSRRP